MRKTDKTSVTLRCNDCGATETMSASRRDDDVWGQFNKFQRFDAKVAYDPYDAPRVLSAACKKCNRPAQIEGEDRSGRKL